MAQAQQIQNNDSLLKYYLSQDKLNIDSSAEAVILYEKGTATPNIRYFRNQYAATLTITVERCIKINSQQALNLADIVIPFSKELKVKDINIQTINLTDGKLSRKNAGRENVLKEKITGKTKVYKFNLPNIKAGSIIYYTYTYFLDIGDPTTTLYYPLEWRFQGKYPVLESWFELNIPNEIKFSVVPKNIKFTLSEKLDQATSGEWTTPDADNRRSICRWVVRNIKAAPDENYVLNPDSKLQKLSIYLSSNFPNPLIKYTYPIPARWQDANQSFFYNQRRLGKCIFQPDDSLSFFLNKLIAGETNNLQLAKKIYRYVRDSIESLGYSGEDQIWASHPPRTVLSQKKGTIPDVNILLAALYQKAGLKSFPILLSTVENGVLDEHHFEPDMLNYLITCLIIDKRYYLLDASSKTLPFGVLKPECYNGFSWLVNERGLPVTITPDSLKDNNTVYCTLTPTAQPDIYQLSIREKMGNVTGPAMRALLEKDSARVKKEIEKEISFNKLDARLKSFSIASENNPDTGLILVYELELTLPASGSVTYLNPFLHKFYESNPFLSADRKYPVEFGYTFNRQYILNFRLPKGYELEDYDNPVSLDFDHGGMTYQNVMSYDKEANVYYLRSILTSRQSVVKAEQYNELQSFFSRLITEQSKKIVIKKTN